MQKLLSLALVVALASPAFAWNEKGHLVVCRLAWLQMNDQQRGQVTRHPEEAPPLRRIPDQRKARGVLYGRVGVHARRRLGRLGP